MSLGCSSQDVVTFGQENAFKEDCSAFLYPFFFHTEFIMLYYENIISLIILVSLLIAHYASLF